MLINFTVTVKLICAFVFAYADCWFSDVAAHLILLKLQRSCLYMTIADQWDVNQEIN